MAYQKVQIVFDPKKWKKDPAAVFALYNSYNDIAVPIDEKELDDMLERDDIEALNDYFVKGTDQI